MTPSGHRQQHALAEKEAGDAGRARAERAANGNLALARLRADQKQVRDVGTGHEQHQPDGGEQNPERARDVTDRRFLQRHRRRLQAALTACFPGRPDRPGYAWGKSAISVFSSARASAIVAPPPQSPDTDVTEGQPESGRA